jgi:hypothetical protein
MEKAIYKITISTNKKIRNFNIILKNIKILNLNNYK